jgi:tetratricopeptide (TPR) repeat protein
MAAIASGLFTVWVERKLIGAEGVDFDLTVAQRGLLAGRVIWFYLGKLLWPHGLVFVYPRWDVPLAAPGWWTYSAAAVALTAVLWLRRRRGRGPLAIWLFFIGSLFPALGFFNVYPFIFSYVADHFQYLPSLGVITAVAAGAAQLWARAARAVRAIGWGVGAALIAILSLLSRGQSRAYADLATLYGTTIAQNPECWMAYNNLGGWYEARGNRVRAVTCYQAALLLRPDYADAHNNLGTAFSHMPGHLADAITQYQAALRLKPDLAEVHYNLANAWSALPGRSAEAIAEYQAALRIQPDHPAAHFNLGNVYVQVPGHLADATVQYQEALRLMPGFAEGHVNLGNAWSHTPGRLTDAIAQYEEALRLRPDYPAARFNLALALLRTPGRTQEAAPQLQALLRDHPENEKARQFLAQIQGGSP